MGHKTLGTILATLAIGGSLMGCISGAPETAQPATSEEIVSTSTPILIPTTTPFPTPTTTPLMSRKYNPIAPNISYDYTKSFDYLEEPVVNGLEGTVVDSYLGLLTLPDGSFSSLRPFSWLVLRDKDTVEHYLIYPAERIFKLGCHVSIEEYWPLKDGTALMNNMLLYIILPSPGPNYNDFFEFASNFKISQLDFPIQSSAPDGRVDGIIKYDGVQILDKVTEP